MQNHKISVIIPVYNAEATISNILQKLIAQEYRNVEIITINDGSKDGSLKILRQFAKKDKRIIVMSQKNGGVSAARNAGIGKATGEFITFIDSDDDISERLIVELASRITDDSDFIMCGMSINGKNVTAHEICIDDRKLTTQYVLQSLLTKNLLYGPYCKLFRQSVVQENDLLFPEDIGYGEDTIFVLGYLCNVENIVVIERSLYLYSFGPTGLAAANSGNALFRRARTRALAGYMEDRLTIATSTMYLLVRARWFLAWIKATLNGGKK